MDECFDDVRPSTDIIPELQTVHDLLKVFRVNRTAFCIEQCIAGLLFGLDGIGGRDAHDAVEEADPVDRCRPRVCPEAFILKERSRQKGQASGEGTIECLLAEERLEGATYLLKI